MEDLTKTQFILLVLLVSFITSIGTGIITVSLLQDAPSTITQTVNRVVEKTIEKVVPSDNSANVKQVTVKETVVVKEEDLVVDSIEKNSKSSVRIIGVVAPETKANFYGRGFIVGKDGPIVTDRRNLREGVAYRAVFSDGSEIPLSVISNEEGNKLGFLKVIKNEKEEKISIPDSVILGDSNGIKLGQTVIALSGNDRSNVSIGRIIGLIEDVVQKVQNVGATVSTGNNPDAKTDSKKEEETPPVPSIAFIETDIVPKDSVSGGALVNLSGEVVGISILSGETSEKSVIKYIPSNYIKDTMAAISASAKSVAN